MVKKETETEQGYEEGDSEKVPKKPKEEDEAETRLDVLEDDMKAVKSSMGKIEKMLEKAIKKQEEKEPEEEKPEEEKKEEKKPEEEEEKKKDVAATEVKPSPEGGELKLPKSVGETDEDKPVESGEVKLEIVEKTIKKGISEGVKEVLKSMGLNKTTTPRPKHETAEMTKDEPKELALDLIKRSKEGTLTAAQMKREIDGNIQKGLNERVKKVLDY